MNMKSMLIAGLFACILSSTLSIAAEPKTDEWLKNKTWNSYETLQAGAAIGGVTGAGAALTAPALSWVATPFIGIPISWYVMWCARHKITDAVADDAIDKGEFVDKGELKYNAWVADWVAWASVCTLLWRYR